MLLACRRNLSPHVVKAPTDLLICLLTLQKFLWHFLMWFPFTVLSESTTKFKYRCLDCTRILKNLLTLTWSLISVRIYVLVSKSQFRRVDTGISWEIVPDRLITVLVLKIKHIWNSNSGCTCLLCQKCFHQSNFLCFQLSYITREFHLFSFAVTHEKQRMLIQYSWFGDWCGRPSVLYIQYRVDLNIGHKMLLIFSYEVSINDQQYFLMGSGPNFWVVSQLSQHSTLRCNRSKWFFGIG